MAILFANPAAIETHSAPVIYRRTDAGRESPKAGHHMNGINRKGLAVSVNKAPRHRRQQAVIDTTDWTDAQILGLAFRLLKANGVEVRTAARALSMSRATAYRRSNDSQQAQRQNESAE